MIHELQNKGFIFNEDTGIVIQPELPAASDNDIFFVCNFARFESAKIYEDRKGLIFINCNLTNCILPSDAQVSSDSNTAQIDYEVENVPI